MRVLGSAANGKVPADLVFSLLGLGMPAMAQLMLPLCLFIAILLTFGRLYAESEITVMLCLWCRATCFSACGVNAFIGYCGTCCYNVYGFRLGQFKNKLQLWKMQKRIQQWGRLLLVSL